MWWCAKSTYEIDEILVLREYNDLRLACLTKDVRVFRLSQAKVANVHGVQRELPANPATNTWRNVGIHPQDHGRTTEWLTRLLANRRHA